MKNILLLFNPYYEDNIIEQHLTILKTNSIVAFGKVKSKLREDIHPNQEILDEIYKNTTLDNPIQLFLTDYNSMYVANSIRIQTKLEDIQVPYYYKDLEVEYWFVLDDIRLIFYKNFENIRDNVLANFNATNFNNHTYTIYGNPYVYPMEVTMKKEINYFEKDDESYKFYFNTLKTKEQLQIRQTLIDYSFGDKKFNGLHISSQENIIDAELEYMKNKNNLLYDFSSVVLRYSKAFETEIYFFLRALFAHLIKADSSIKDIKYSLQGRDYKIKDLMYRKASFGTYLYLLKNEKIKEAINNHISFGTIRYFIFNSITYFTKSMQKIRNESAHGGLTQLSDCEKLRQKMIGVGDMSIMVELYNNLKYLTKNKM